MGCILFKLGAGCKKGNRVGCLGCRFILGVIGAAIEEEKAMNAQLVCGGCLGSAATELITRTKVAISS